ncbi:MAG: hypothetical protein JRI23_06965 [Deltaproteobacteria bacterium]|nr:hypothetical protein [Deltaproteobacteria bacterium]MBW2531328.1 hypothetical protein [Deltaproteobacteria bacterium]
MGIDAVALLRVPLSALTQSLDPPPDGQGVLKTTSGQTVKLEPLDDGCLIRGFAPFGSEPDELHDRLAALLGSAVDDHGDDRGIYVFPDKVRPQSRAYADVIEEVGEIGFWVEPTVAPTALSAAASGLPADLKAQLDGLMGGADPGALDELGQAMASGDAAQLGKLSEQLRGAVAGDGPIPADLERSMQEALDQARGLLGGADGLPGAPATSAGPAGAPPLGDLSALAEAAQQQLQSLSAEEREQVAAMARQFGLPIGDPADLMAALGGLGAALDPTASEPAAADEEPAPGDDETPDSER